MWEHCEREGVLDPGVFPVAAELVEALVELERFDEAARSRAGFEELAAQQDHPWARATAKRCAALIELARRLLVSSAGAMLGEASADLKRLGLRVRQRPLPARARAGAAALQAVARRARDASAGGDRVRRARRRRVGAAGAGGARACRRAPARRMAS